MINKVRALSDIVQSFLTGWPRDNRAKTGLALYYWPKVIGEELKTKTEAVKVTNGILWIKTPDPSLAYNLTFFKKEIIDKYQNYLGDKFIRTVRIIVGEISFPYDYGKKEEDNKEGFYQTIPSSLYKEMEQINDPELRKVFIDFYQRHQSMKG